MGNRTTHVVLLRGINVGGRNKCRWRISLRNSWIWAAATCKPTYKAATPSLPATTNSLARLQ
jgi:hypothetical protein